MSERFMLAIKIGALLIVVLAALSQAPENRIAEIGADQSNSAGQ
jgi:hypothetical protein